MLPIPLIGIAKATTVSQPTSREFLSTVRLSASTGSDAKDVLEGDDFIIKGDDGWEVLDSVLAGYLRGAGDDEPIR